MSEPKPEPVMTPRDARTVIALLQHLDGSHAYDETDLADDVLELHASAAAALTDGAPPLDEDALLATLTQTAQRFADSGWYDDDTDVDAQARRPAAITRDIDNCADLGIA